MGMAEPRAAPMGTYYCAATVEKNLVALTIWNVALPKRIEKKHKGNFSCFE